MTKLDHEDLKDKYSITEKIQNRKSYKIRETRILLRGITMKKTEKIKKFRRIWKKESFFTAVNISLNFFNRKFYSPALAKIFPKEKNATLNGVKMFSSNRLPHLKHGKYLPFYIGGNNPSFSEGEVNAHKELTNQSDDVVVIGGGHGVSAVRAAQICNPGKVYI